MTLHHSEILRHPGQGLSYWLLGDLYTFKAIGEETGEAYTLCEVIVQPQSGSPPHRHSREDEAFYVQSGEFEFHLDEQTIIASAGTFLHSPKGQQHQFTNISSTPATLLVWVTPAGFEKFVAEVGTAISGSVTPAPAVSEADLDKIQAAAPKYGIEILPPPG
ncbi:cupin domain-containing protein [Leptolyngbya sp. FACHB-17]|uniref:cupin domain-containing protein n=1 Tax=unclassified Leptolyngbya TaxID=2650499 RepID=UPI00168077F5|nr:cupin domain-containing protein [Leptolyngbya sp. FACHB-17]MBD2082760.1 cupin domain-containing protein [Leptolyngbya sp. FACHB-17]